VAETPAGTIDAAATMTTTSPRTAADSTVSDMPELSVGYHVTRRRVAELVGGLDDADLKRPVPACPAWDVHDLLAHMSGIPDELSAGRYPSGDTQAWLDGIVEARKDVAADELLARWEATEGSIDTLIDGGAGQMLADVVSHEHDLRAAVGRPGARGAAEVRAVVQIELELLKAGMEEAGLGALVVDSGEVQWASHFAKPACTLRVDPWEAIRLLQSRRTADEIRATPCSGDIEPYIEVMAAHSPLPESSLHER
jgi:uncharacterized protein (TIGR03083 family)